MEQYREKPGHLDTLCNGDEYCNGARPKTNNKCIASARSRRKQIQKEIFEANSQISSLEKDLCRTTGAIERDAQGRLQEIRNEKSSIIRDRQNTDTELQELSKSISAKLEAHNNLKITLQYRNEEKINEAVKRLEHQLHTNRFILREERKIVQEIDRLKRSKKTVREFLEVKQELDGLRDQQKAKRDKRDSLFKRIVVLKVDEDEALGNLRTIQADRDTVRKDLNIWNESLKKLQTELETIPPPSRACRNMENTPSPSQETKGFPDCGTKPRHPTNRPVSNERRRVCPAPEPYQTEIELCVTLTGYLKRILPMSTCLEMDGDSGSKRERRQEKKNRKKTNKPLSHGPSVFSQFSEVGLEPPFTIADIPKLIERLNAQKAHFKALQNDKLTPKSDLTPDPPCTRPTTLPLEPAPPVTFFLTPASDDSPSSISPSERYIWTVVSPCTTENVSQDKPSDGFTEAPMSVGNGRHI